MDQKIIELRDLIEKANHIVFFGGAGVSTESGILDFRSETGLYKLKSKWNKPYEVMLSHEYFEQETDNFYKFYREFMINTTAKPNYAHEYLARLEKRKKLTIITQNIDGLHQMAGSQNVIELHGSIHRNYCTKCMTMYSLEDILKMDNVPHCPKCGGLIKPDVVLYDEQLNEMNITKALIAIQEADLMIVAGTSLKVYPAAGLINYFYGDNIVLINKVHVPVDKKIKLEINDKVGQVFKEVDELSKGENR
ncbi:MAG: NAD-dependent protein deacylase [Bacilli bacterium]|jgi:NAD-dependent deacetylase